MGSHLFMVEEALESVSKLCSLEPGQPFIASCGGTSEGQKLCANSRVCTMDKQGSDPSTAISKLCAPLFSYL